MSAFGGKADIADAPSDVCFCPKADIEGQAGDCTSFKPRDWYRLVGQAKGDIPYGGARGPGFHSFGCFALSRL